MTRRCSSARPRAATSISACGSPSDFGLAGEEAETYAGTVVASDLKEAGHEDLMAKVMADIAERGVALEELEVRAKLEEFSALAKTELMKEAE